MHSAKHYRVEEHLLDGGTAVLRAIRPSDKGILIEGMHHFSPQALYYRFLTPKRELTTAELKFFTELDFQNHVALLTFVKRGNEEIPVGVGRYVVTESPADRNCAEIAFAVEDEFQDRGIATLLMKHLALIARKSKLEYFKALVLSDNLKMLKVLRHSGLPFTSKLHTAGVLEIKISLMPERAEELLKVAGTIN